VKAVGVASGSVTHQRRAGPGWAFTIIGGGGRGGTSNRGSFAGQHPFHTSPKKLAGIIAPSRLGLRRSVPYIEVEHMPERLLRPMEGGPVLLLQFVVSEQSFDLDQLGDQILVSP
jgi:hypothetical protein